MIMGVQDSDPISGSSIRETECTLAILKRSDGSAVYCQGKSEVVTAIYGPGEVKQSKELMDKATIECIFKPKSGLPGCQEKFLEKIIRTTAETILLSKLHPRSSISIICQVIQDDGSLLSCALNSVCMAFVNAGVPMDCMFAAASCSINKNGSINLDPDQEAEQNSKALVTTVFESRTKKLLTCETKGLLTMEEYFSCIDCCRTASEKVFAFQRNCVKRFLTKEEKEEESDQIDHFE